MTRTFICIGFFTFNRRGYLSPFVADDRREIAFRGVLDLRFAALLDELEDLANRFFEIACNTESRFNAGPDVPMLQARHIGATHFEPKRQLGFFNPFGGEALGQLICQLAVHIPDANMASFTYCEHHKINKV